MGDSDQTTTTFYETKNHSACSSIYEPYQFPYSSYTVPIVPLKRILDFFPFEVYPVIDYIKIDAQGADLDILKGMGHYLKERVICVTAEPEQNAYKNTNNSIEEILSFMQQQGFKRMKNSRVEDPTFVNKKFMNLFYEKRLNKIIYQEG